MANDSSSDTNQSKLDFGHIILICIYAVTVFFMVVLGCLCLNKYRSMKKVIWELRQKRPSVPQVPSQDSPPPSPNVLNIPELPDHTTESPLQRQPTKSIRFPWKPPLQVPRFTKADLNLIQLIKAGREGVFYKARIMRGTCRGHSLVTCKIGKEGITSKQMENEVSIMRKLAYHKNVMQLLDWNTAEARQKHIMQDCWMDPYTNRPSFTDIVKILESVVESDGDYVDVDNQRIMNAEEK
ncbi:uncharacterized protein LOC107743727 [Sinocyclocheilus rhinocerous]|uniref:uncharacterized protein LOC107743727 n=1 Tax=Sinocyclocheilus rhinocerous TaxID=307959 RepID=UPI0007B890F1|nr:PREDICTED: uncharacterized protein LOC107743727 [Sinocyclocheilus rhinocerous]